MTFRRASRSCYPHAVVPGNPIALRTQFLLTALPSLSRVPSRLSPDTGVRSDRLPYCNGGLNLDTERRLFPRPDQVTLAVANVVRNDDRSPAPQRTHLSFFPALSIWA